MRELVPRSLIQSDVVLVEDFDSTRKTGGGTPDAVDSIVCLLLNGRVPPKIHLSNVET
jgi:hypothetical protein